MQSDELIRSALLAEADRAPSDLEPSDLLGEVGPRRGVGRRLGVVIPAAAAVVVVAAGIPVVVSHLAGDRQVQTAVSAPATCPPQELPPVTAGSALSFPMCYLPTKLPAGWIGWSREVAQGNDGTAKVPPTILSWEKPGHGSQRSQYMYLTIGTAAHFEPEAFTVDGEIGIVEAPIPVGSNIATTKQIGPDHQVDINGVTGTRRVIQATENLHHTVFGTVDAVTWSPAPGVVLTLHITGATGDEVNTLLAVARSVAPSPEAVTLPFQVPAMPAGAKLVGLSVLGTGPRNWEAVASFKTSETSFLVSWGPAYGIDRMPVNVTVRGAGAFYEHIDTGDGDIELTADGNALVVQGKPEAELVRIADGMTFQPDSQFSWLGR
jgi:hypothetical protein